MDKALILFLSLFQTMQIGFHTPQPSAVAATPVFIQMAAAPNDVQSQVPISGATTGTVAMHLPFPNTLQVGNTVVLHVRTGESTANITVTDDGSSSNTYTLGPHTANGGSTTAIYTAPVTNTARNITITFATPSAATNNEADAYEFENLGAVDVSCTGTATSGTAPACTSSMTPTASGDLVVGFADVVTFSSTPSGPMSFTAQTGTTPTYSLLNADGTSWAAGQYGVYSGTSAITPSITLSQATTRTNVASVAIKAATSGGGFTGIHVNSVRTFVPTHAFSSGTTTATTEAVQVPCTGNSIWLLAGQAAGSATPNVTSVTDSNSNTWTRLAGQYSAGDGYAQLWSHADSATCSGTETITLHMTSGAQFMQVVALDISNATGYDSSATCGSGSTPCNIGSCTRTAGNDTCTSTSSTNPPTTVVGGVITPSTSTGVVLSLEQQDFNTVSGSSTGVFIAPTETCTQAGCNGGVSGTGSVYPAAVAGWCQDYGLVLHYYTSTSAFTVGPWSFDNSQNQAVQFFFSSTVAVKQ